MTKKYTQNPIGDNFWRQIIANELAEANRLKRMELKYLGEDVISEKAAKELYEQVKKLKDEA